MGFSQCLTLVVREARALSLNLALHLFDELSAFGLPDVFAQSFGILGVYVIAAHKPFDLSATPEPDQELPNGVDGKPDEEQDDKQREKRCEHEQAFRTN